MLYTFSISKTSILTIENAYVYVNDIYKSVPYLDT